MDAVFALEGDALCVVKTGQRWCMISLCFVEVIAATQNFKKMAKSRVIFAGVLLRTATKLAGPSLE